MARRDFILQMATENLMWGEGRIANKLLLTFGLRVSPRAVRKYMPKRPPNGPRGDQRWASYLRNHAKAIFACDFFGTVTATFRRLYLQVVIHHESRRLLHLNITTNLTVAWTLQQLREAIGFEDAHCYLIHDRDSIFARSSDESINSFGLRVLKSPPQSPKANAICKRVIGTIRHKCLNWRIPLTESHLRLTRKEWVAHYNQAPPHMALGPGIPDPVVGMVWPAINNYQHDMGAKAAACARSALGGLHHEYSHAATVA